MLLTSFSFFFVDHTGVIPFSLSSKGAEDIIGERVVVGGFVGVFYYYEGTARLTIASNGTLHKHYVGNARTDVIQRAGEVLVTGKQILGLSGSAALTRCGYAGVSHQKILDDGSNGEEHGAIIPKYMVEECLQQNPGVWQRCVIVANSAVPVLPDCQ